MTVEAALAQLPSRVTVIGPEEPVAQDELPLRVLLISEATYPFAWGGVSTWCDALVRVMPEVRFSVLSVSPYPGMRPVFDLPTNVEVLDVPLWGLRDVREADSGLRELRDVRRATTPRAVARDFLGPFSGFVRGILAPTADPRSLAQHVHALHRFLIGHDLQTALRDRQVWDAYAAEATAAYERAGTEGSLPSLAMWELTTGFQWISRWLFPIARPLPEVDVVHPATAGVSSLVAVAAAYEHGAGLMLTEHGVYLRERYLAEASRTDSWFLKLLGIRFARRMTELVYAMADQISPCCDYNQRWELAGGATREQLETLYYGVDAEQFSSESLPSEAPNTVVWVGRINPLKDVETLLRSAAVVLRERPQTQFKLYGTAPKEDADYHLRCLALHEELGLGENVEFCGYTADPASAFSSGDVVVLSSVSEGFPYSTLEAMLCSRPVVSTSVGGLPEQVAGAGIVVEPRNPEAMGAALLELLQDPERCRRLGAAARHKATTEFGYDRFRGSHKASYLRLSPRHGWWLHNGSSVPPGLEPGPESDHDAAGDAERIIGVLRLADDVRGLTAHPVDSLEVAAVLESSGVSDATARAQYGAADVFALAADVFTVLRERDEGIEEQPAAGPVVVVAPRGAGSVLDTARYPWLALLPSVALLVALWALPTLGGWSSRGVLALTVGMTAGMLITNGLALAMGRRASMLISLGNGASARRVIAATAVLGVASTGATAGTLVLVAPHDIAFVSQQRTVFVLSALALAVLWLLAAALSLVCLAGLTGVALTAAVAVGVDLNWVLSPVSAHHFGIAVTVGFLTAVVVMWGGLRWALPAHDVSPGGALPSSAYLFLEGLPFFLYGTLAVTVFVSVHVLGWLVLHGEGAVTTLELGLLLPLAPVALGAGRAERSLRRFWALAGELQRTTTVSESSVYACALAQLRRRERRTYLRGLLVSSIATAALVELLLAVHGFGAFPDVDVVALRSLYASGLVAYAVLGWAQFEAMFGLSLQCWRGPLSGAAAAAVITPLVAWWTATTYGYRTLGLALLVGGAVYGTTCSLVVRRLLARADHAYVAAL